MASSTRKSDADKFTKRIYDCLVTSVLVHRSLSTLELEQAFFSDYFPMHLSEALILAGFQEIVAFVSAYPDDIRHQPVRSYSGTSDYFVPGPRPPKLIEDNVRLIRSTESHKRPNPFNREKGIMGNPKFKWGYEEAARRSKLAKPAKRPEKLYQPVQEEPPPPLARTNGLIPTSTTTAIRNAELDSGSIYMPLLAPDTYSKDTAPSKSGSRIDPPHAVSNGFHHPPGTVYFAPHLGRVPIWYNNEEDSRGGGWLPTPRRFVPSAVRHHPMSNRQFLDDDRETDQAMAAEYSKMAAEFKRTGLLPTPDEDSDDEDGFAISVPFVGRESLACAARSSLVRKPAISVTPAIGDKRLREIVERGMRRSVPSQTMGIGLASCYLARMQMYRELREYNGIAAV